MNNGKKGLIKTDVRILWHSNYYDGPLSGIAEYKGEKVLFNCKKEYSTKKLYDKLFRAYELYRLTPEQWKEISYWHEEFRLFVGTHCDYKYDDNKEIFSRSVGETTGASHDYVMEMYYERHAAHEAAHGHIEDEIIKPQNLIGWVVYDVLLGKPCPEW